MGTVVVTWRMIGRIAGTAVTAALIAFCASAEVAHAGGDANMASCPAAAESSPGFRAYLPDCRAYELVTPTTNSAHVYAPRIAEDGAELIGHSAGAFAGLPANVFEGFYRYRFARTASGWQVSPILAGTQEVLSRPQSEAFVDTASTDGKRTLVEILNPTGAFGFNSRTLYINERETGTYVRVGPRWPGPAHEGAIAEASASADLGVIVFQNAAGQQYQREQLLWPGDTTKEGGSLYEYRGIGNSEPKLVGVSNEGPLRTNSEAKLISDCGTHLGGGFTGDTYNAISGNGEVVFFTAENYFGKCAQPTAARELYARIDGDHTVALSEPVLPGGPAGECASGEPCDGAADAEANFQGASAGGTRVLFLSEQPLVNGATAAGMKLYEERLEGGKVVEVTDLGNRGAASGLNPEVQGVVRMSESGHYVYFVAGGKLTGANREGTVPEAGGDNLYVYEQDEGHPNGRLAFVGTLASEDSQLWNLHDFERAAQATPDGRFLVFVSAARLTSDDTSSDQQLFEYDAETEMLARVSVGQRGLATPAGYNSDGNSSRSIDDVAITPDTYSGQAEPGAYSGKLTVTADGTEVFFQSALALTPQALNDVLVKRSCPVEESLCVFYEQTYGVSFWQYEYARNVYEYRSEGGEIANGNVYLISSGDDLTPSGHDEAVQLLGTDAAGQNVFFTTTSALVPQDTNTQQDIYDAKVDGGFPGVATTTSCVGDSCRGQTANGPGTSGAQSAEQHPGGNLTARRRQMSKPTSTGHRHRLTRALRRCAHRYRRNHNKRRLCEQGVRGRLRGKAGNRSGRSRRGHDPSAGLRKHAGKTDRSHNHGRR